MYVGLSLGYRLVSTLQAQGKPKGNSVVEDGPAFRASFIPTAAKAELVHSQYETSRRSLTPGLPSRWMALAAQSRACGSQMALAGLPW